MESQVERNKVIGAEINAVERIDDENKPKGKVMNRGKWGGKMEFILTCIGYAVGLGNVWRFPYLVFKNGGGAFLIPYWTMQLFVGMPLFFMELSFGQFASLGPITIWKVSPLMKGVGYCMVISTALITLYYNVIIAYCFYYLFASMTSVLPFSHCNHSWSSSRCSTSTASDNSTTNTSLSNMTTVASFVTTNLTTPATDFLTTTKETTVNMTITPSEDFFINFVLKQSSGIDEVGEFQWKIVLYLLLAWTVVFFVLIKGIKTLGKVVYFTAIFPYVILTALLIRGATLDGAYDGVMYYLTPKWEKLADSTVWSDAATQVFYSLSVCSGGLILMSSFNKFDNNCLRDAILVPCVDCITSFFSGFVIFTVLGFMAKEKNVSVEKVVDGGPGLAFIAYPEAIAKMPAPTVWAILFFCMMIIIGFSSQFSLMETVISSLSDEWESILRKNWKRSLIFRITMCIVFFLLGLPMTTQAGMYILNMVDTSVGGFPLLFAGVFECVAVNFVYGYKNFASDVSMMLGKKPSIYWRVCWCLLTPLLLSTVIIFKAIQYTPLTYKNYIYPTWSQALGLLIMLFPILAFPVHFLFEYCRKGGFSVLIKNIRPLPEWGPSLPENRTGHYASPDRWENGNVMHTEYDHPINHHKISMGVTNIGFEFDKGNPPAYPDLDNTQL